MFHKCQVLILDDWEAVAAGTKVLIAALTHWECGSRKFQVGNDFKALDLRIYAAPESS